MNGPGFDWLNIPSSHHSGYSSPAPAVSFGFNNKDTQAENHANSNYQLTNASADKLTNNHSTSYVEVSEPGADVEDDTSIPLSLTAHELTLEESKTYMRWYSDILARTNSRTITINDVYSFLNNFKIPPVVKEKINRVFSKILNSINIGEFFALLRLISHTLYGEEPKRMLVKVRAPVPQPPSILSKKRQSNDVPDEDEQELPADNSENSRPLDLDGFTQFMLTGERPDEIPRKKKSRKSKSVKFSDQVVTDIHDEPLFNTSVRSPSPSQLDYSLPMDQLLDRMKQTSTSQDLTTQQEEEEQEILKDMEPQINHFKNLNSVDTVSRNGVPLNVDPSNSGLLKPNMTGPAQMAHIFSPSPEPEVLKPNMTGPNQMTQIHQGDPSDANQPARLQPNMTGPSEMARLFSPTPDDRADVPQVTLQSFTAQMTGNTLANTLHNTAIGADGNGVDHNSPSALNRPLPPPPVPNSRRSRSISSPIPHQYSSAGDTGEGLGSWNSTQNTNNSLVTPHVPPAPPRSPLSFNETHKKVPPVPPPSRRKGSASVPPPLPPKVPSNASPGIYSSESGSTANILQDLKALEEEVDKIRDMTGGF